jgi:hypothetical protein
MAAVHHLDRIERHFASPDRTRSGFVRMVAITSWWADDDQGGHGIDGTAEIVRPESWVGNLAHEKIDPTSHFAFLIPLAIVGVGLLAGLLAANASQSLLQNRRGGGEQNRWVFEYWVWRIRIGRLIVIRRSCCRSAYRLGDNQFASIVDKGFLW